MRLPRPLRTMRRASSIARASVPFFIAYLVSGCTGQEARILPAQSDFVITIERGVHVPEGSLFLKPIPGRLLGKTSDVELFRSKPGRDEVRIPLDALSADVERHARLAASDDANPGELASPRGLRIARIGAFYEPAIDNPACDNYRTGLRASTAASTMLVYVDRPGSVRGTRYTQPYIMDYRLDFPAEGIYAIALPAHRGIVTPRVVALRDLSATVRTVCGEDRSGRTLAHASRRH